MVIILLCQLKNQSFSNKEAKMGKSIEIVKRRVGDLRLDFGNPRTIKAKKKKDLESSLNQYGDFDIIVINDKDQVIGGHQRVTILKEQNPDMMVDCKMLSGYTDIELKYVNIKLNSHAGDWDLDLLADWNAEISVDLGIEDAKKKDIDERSIPEMELIHYEKYDYVMIVCRNELDYNDLVRKLGIEDATVSISKRKIKARAVWYDQMNAELVPKNDKESDDIQDNEEGGVD
jgi:hypothetical protein